MDQQSNRHTNNGTIISTSRLAEKRSDRFLKEVLYPRGIKVITDRSGLDMLKSLRNYLNNPSQRDLEQALGEALVELDASTVVRVFHDMTRNHENEAMHEAQYRKYFLKSGLYGSYRAVCCCIQLKMIVEGLQQSTWIPLPVATDRRESGIGQSTKVWDLVSKIYPPKLSDDKANDKYFVPDHVYAISARDNLEQKKINQYGATLPGFLLMKGQNGIMAPYLVQESKDHEEKEIEARQYLSLLAASALHDRMLLRSLADEAQATKMIALDRELCIYGMTCCGPLVTIYEMSIRDIWSDLDSSKFGKPVRYDFLKVEALNLTNDLGCKELSDWMNTLHYYGRTSLAQSIMQDGDKAYSSRKAMRGGFQREFSQIVFLYGQQPNTAIFNTDNKGNKGDKGHEGDEGDESHEDHEGEGNDGNDSNEGNSGIEDAYAKRRKICNHACQNQTTQLGRFCKHKCCIYSRQNR